MDTYLFSDLKSSLEVHGGLCDPAPTNAPSTCKPVIAQLWFIQPQLSYEGSTLVT